MRPPESFIGQPIRSLQTMLRVLSEDDDAHLPVIPDGIYGPETAAAVSRFQQLHGLGVTGVTDLATWEAIVSEYEPARIRRDNAQSLDILLDPGEIIRKGASHPHVYLIQAMLTVLALAYESLLPPPLTGILDDITSDSIAFFQQLSRLPMTGHMDKVTWKHLALHYPLAARLYHSRKSGDM